MNKKSVFITGTDTGVGKTIVAGLLARFLLEKGLDTVTQKWIQTGCNRFSEDIDTHLKLMMKTRSEYERYICDMEPCILNFPASPHLAASLEGKKIDRSDIIRSWQKLEVAFEAVVVEGTGGIMVPVDDETMIVDMCEDSGMSVIIVAPNCLGAINQTVLTVEALRKRNIDIVGVVFNRLSNEVDKQIATDNPRIINRITGVDILGELPNEDDPTRLYNMFLPVAREIFKKWRQDG